MLQIQRWRKKKKGGGKKSRKSYVKGKVIDGRHELYTLSIAVMLGVRTSVAKTNAIITTAGGRRTLTPQDFMCEEKYEFAPKVTYLLRRWPLVVNRESVRDNPVCSTPCPRLLILQQQGSPTTPPHKLSHTFKFKDYAPMAFAYIRRMFGVNEFDFLLSVCGNANFIEFISNAKSGQFFFYSSDGKYMIKTMTNAESKFLRRSKYLGGTLAVERNECFSSMCLAASVVLPHYFMHCSHYPNTLITKFLGMYRVKLYHLRRNVKFVIMNSVYYTDKYLQTFYDLKGSDVGRDAKPGQDVLKDNDLRKKLPQEALSIPPEIRVRVRDQVVADCKFLSQMQIMDYSMLIGIHHVPPRQNDAQSLAHTGFRIRHSGTRHPRKGSKTGQDMVGGVKFDDLDRNGVHSDGGSAGSNPPDSARSSFSNEAHDSTRKLIMDIRDSNVSMSNMEMGLFEEEDDNSYLEGSEERDRLLDTHKNLRGSNQSHAVHDDIEMKKEETIEQIYWPFHRFFDINGLRRVKPKPCYRCQSHPCKCEGHAELIKAWGIPEFEPPLSTRKDGGLVMDTTNLELPMVFKGPQGNRQYEGKIFYMGIIDILQQYNVRKRVETSYRKAEGMGKSEPSCVHPDDYATRFIEFFDEYSAQCVPVKGKGHKNATNDDEKAEIELSIGGTGKAKVDSEVEQTVPMTVAQASSESQPTGPGARPLPAKEDQVTPLPAKEESSTFSLSRETSVRTSQGATLDVSGKTQKRINLPIF